MGVHCCREKHEEIIEPDTYNQNNYGDTYTFNHDGIFKTKPSCWFGHRCECPCHNGGVCIFKIKSK